MTTALFAIGEELGWRGFLVPELAKSMGIKQVALLSGFAWALWHWPLMFLASGVTGLNALNPWFALLMLTLILIGAGSVLAIITLKSNSLWPAVVMHGSQNAFTHGFFMASTEQTDLSIYFVSEAGAFLAVFWIIAAITFLRYKPGSSN